MKLGKAYINKEKDILKVRKATSDTCKSLKFDFLNTVRIVTAASELTRNIYEHAGKGEILFETVKKENGIGLKLVFKDKGQGIEHLDEILSGNYNSSEGLGIGLYGAKELMDEFKIETKSGRGTVVEIIKWLPSEKQISKEIIDGIQLNLKNISEELALDSLKSQNREIMKILDELRQKNLKIENINEELEITNAGIISLYKEIDQKNIELKKKSQNKTQFLRTISHEIKTPINSIISLTEVLKEKISGDLTPEQKKQIMMISENAQYLSNLVKDLLNLSKIEEGVIEVNIDEFLIKNLFYEIEVKTMPLAKEKNLKLEFHMENEDEVINSDNKLIQKILINFLENAIKYTDKGRIDVFQKKEKRNSKEFINFEVRDTGRGIPEENLEEIFLEFKKAHIDHDDKGTGLGLTITKKLVQKLKGKINVSSSPGKGSSFTFTLPIDKKTVH